MKKNNFIEQSRRDNTHEVQLTPYKAEGCSVGMIPSTKAEGRSMGSGTCVKATSHSMRMITIILLALSLLAVSCTKPEKKELAGAWRWTSTTGGIGGGATHPKAKASRPKSSSKAASSSSTKTARKSYPEPTTLTTRLMRVSTPTKETMTNLSIPGSTYAFI